MPTPVRDWLILIAASTIPYHIVPRRLGDVASLVADPSLANEELGWRAEFGLEEMCLDYWHWVLRNPRGYAGEEERESLPGSE